MLDRRGLQSSFAICVQRHLASILKFTDGAGNVKDVVGDYVVVPESTYLNSELEHRKQKPFRFSYVVE